MAVKYLYERSALGLMFAVLKYASDTWSRVSMKEFEFVQYKFESYQCGRLCTIVRQLEESIHNGRK